MKKTARNIILATILPLALSGCFWGDRVQVPPAYEGKVLTKNGYLPDTYPPSTFRLAPCWQPGAICQELVLIERSDVGFKESFDLFMPRNQLKMQFDLRMTASIRDGSTDAILNRVVPVENESTGGRKIIRFAQVYNTYAQPILRDAVRAVLAEFTIDEVASSRDAVNAEIRKRLSAALANTPVRLLTVGLAAVDYPDVIVKQKEQAERNRIQIEQEEAKKQVVLVQLQTQLETAKAQRAIRRERAEAAAEENRIAAGSITPEYLEYKKLEVMAAMAANNSAVFVPFNALDEVGLSNRAFLTKPERDQ